MSGFMPVLYDCCYCGLVVKVELAIVTHTASLFPIRFALAIQGFLGSNTNFRIVFVVVVGSFSSSVKSAIGF